VPIKKRGLLDYTPFSHDRQEKAWISTNGPISIPRLFLVTVRKKRGCRKPGLTRKQDRPNNVARKACPSGKGAHLESTLFLMGSRKRRVIEKSANLHSTPFSRDRQKKAWMS
jgi:hypothetical protein